MRTFEKMQFTVRDANSALVFSDVEFWNCYFEGCAISVTDDPRLRSTFRNVKITNCSQRGCGIHAGVFEDCVIDGLNTNGQLLQLWGAVFNRVTLRGKIDKVMVSDVVDTLKMKPHVQRAFDSANHSYYSSVQWAIDISQAEFKDVDLRGVPGMLVRRDPETQVLITRRRALEVDWKTLPFADQFTPYVVSRILERGTDAEVYVVPKRARDFKKLLPDLDLLRKAGVAEPD